MEKREFVVIDCPRTDYSPDDVASNRRTVTVAELKELLDSMPDDALVVTSHDNGYTYGPVRRNSVSLL